MTARASRSKMAQRAIAFTLALLFFWLPVTAEAQFGGKKKWVYAFAGAVIAGVPAYAFSQGNTINDNCSSEACVTVVAASVGAVVGFLIGLESDNRYNRKMAAGPSMSSRRPRAIGARHSGACR